MTRLRYVRMAAERRPGATYVAAAFVGGLVAGALAWSAQIQRSRRELFGASRVRRLAALGYLAGHPGVEEYRLLQDYVRWEQHPALRRRAERLLRRMERYLD